MPNGEEMFGFSHVFSSSLIFPRGDRAIATKEGHIPVQRYK